MSDMKLRVSLGGMLRIVFFCAVGFGALATPSPFWDSLIFTAAILSLVAALIGCIMHRERDRRAYAIGFALVCGLYMGITTLPWLSLHYGSRLITHTLLDLLADQKGAALPPFPGALSASEGGTSGIIVFQAGGTMMMSSSGGTAGYLTGMGAMRAGGMVPTTMTGRSTRRSTPPSPPPPPPPPPPSRWSLWSQPDQAGFFLNQGATTTRTHLIFYIGHSLFAILFGIMGGALARNLARGRVEDRPSGELVS